MSVVTDVEKIRRRYSGSENYYLNLLNKYYWKFINTFIRIHIKRNNNYLNSLDNDYLTFLNKLGLVYIKPHNYRIFLLNGYFFEGKWDGLAGDCIIDIHLTVRLEHFTSQRIFNGTIFERSEARFYDKNITYLEFKKNFTILYIYKEVGEDYSFSVFLPSIYQIDLDCEWSINDKESVCRLFFEYFKQI
jgi:hypothetical protein